MSLNNEPKSFSPEAVYDEQGEQYTSFGEQSFSWRYMEQPALDEFIPDFYNSDSRVLEIGCGYGRVIEHLISRGVKPANITGIDISGKMIELAKKRVSGVELLRASATDFNLIPHSFDLIVSNMTLHYLDNEQLQTALNRIYDHLIPAGTFFFIDTHPDRIEGSKDPANNNQWMDPKTPWGTTTPYFNRSLEAVRKYIRLAGFKLVKTRGLSAPEASKDEEMYEYYANGPVRVAARFVKAPQPTRRNLRSF